MRFVVTSLLASIAVAASCVSSLAASAIVAPHGATYRYTVPRGFHRVAASFPGHAPPFLTTVNPIGGPQHPGTLSTFQWPLTAAQRHWSAKRLAAWFDRETQAFYRDSGAGVTPGAHRRVAGHDAVCWRISKFHNAYDGILDGDSCVVLRGAGRDAVSQTCTWKPATRELMQRGCRALRRSLRIS